MEESRKKTVDKRKVLYYAAVGFFAVVFLSSAIYIGNYLVQSHRSNSAYDDLANRLESIRNEISKPSSGVTDPSGTASVPPASSGGMTDPSQPFEPTEPVILPEYLPFYELNNDMVGWITVPDTKINYPVMQTPMHKDYYLKRNFDKMSSDWGAIYAREVCDINRPSDNVTLYGHHMKDGSMFAGLDKYKKESFWKDHQTFSFDTLYEHHTYRIWAVFKTSGNYGEGFAYHQFSEAESQEEFDQYVSTIQSMAFYDTGITPEYGDKLLCLSTCEYTLNNGRFVVMAVRIS